MAQALTGPVLLIGAGYVGAELGRLLVEAQVEVVGVRRSERALGAGIRAVRADVVTGAGLADLPEAVAQIVFAVAPGERSAAAYRSVYGQGLANVVGRYPGARLILVSSSAVYGSAQASPLSAALRESDAASPDDETSRELLAAEQWLSAHCADSLIVRASGIYGPGRLGLLTHLLVDELGTDERMLLTNRIHRDDLARCLLFLLERHELRGTVNATDSAPSTLLEMQEWLRAQPLPAWLAPGAVGPRHARRSKSRALSNEKLLSLGFRLGYPSFREGYRALLDGPRN